MECQENTKFYQELDVWVADQYRAYREIHEKLSEVATHYLSSPFVPTVSFKKNCHTSRPTSTSADTLVNNQTEATRINYPVFQLAPPCHRFCAEAIDICLMFLVKVAMFRLIGGRELFSDFLGVVIFDFLDGLPGYRCLRFINFLIRNFSLEDGQNIFTYLDHMNTEFLKPFQTESLFLSLYLWIFLRLIVEAVMNSRPILGFGPGGCSFGKYLFNLRVVSCNQIIHRPHAIEVLPGGDIGFWRSFLRSLLKNTSIYIWYAIMQIVLTRSEIVTHDYLFSTMVVKISDDA